MLRAFLLPDTHGSGRRMRHTHACVRRVLAAAAVSRDGERVYSAVFDGDGEK